MNEELDDAAVTAAVAGYPRTGRDLADGYLLAALTIRALYDPGDPEIERSLRLYAGDVRRLESLEQALIEVSYHVETEVHSRQQRELLADAAITQVMPAVPGELTQEIPRHAIGPCGDYEPHRGTTVYWCRLSAGHDGSHEADSGIEGDPYLWD